MLIEGNNKWGKGIGSVEEVGVCDEKKTNLESDHFPFRAVSENGCPTPTPILTPPAPGTLTLSARQPFLLPDRGYRDFYLFPNWLEQR